MIDSMDPIAALQQEEQEKKEGLQEGYPYNKEQKRYWQQYNSGSSRTDNSSNDRRLLEMMPMTTM